jgi:hypothetical protein
MVHRHFSPHPVAFENFAAAMWVQSDPKVANVEVTRPSRDGGRDAVGEYCLGPASDPVRLQFALEAKCLDPTGGGVDVKMVSRLISRIKHREFGILVTTAHIGAQPYQEVREDGHPILFVTGRDLVEILKRMGLNTRDSLQTYLTTQHPTTSLSEGVDVAFVAADVAVEVTMTTPELHGRALESPAAQ